MGKPLVSEDNQEMHFTSAFFFFFSYDKNETYLVTLTKAVVFRTTAIE